MILNSLYLENYRIYKGPETINFAKGERNITIIQGNNEVGKTTIMNAITWCLYGKELYRDEGNDPLWNKNAVVDLDEGEESIVKVEILMKDNKGRDVTFSRTLEFYKESKEKIFSTGNPNFKIIRDDNGNDKEISNTETYIATHLPKKIREYFLFDGEQLEKYFNKDSTNEIKNSVLKLSQLNLLKKIIDHVGSTEKEYIADLKELNPQLNEFLGKKSILEEDYTRKQEELSLITDELKECDLKIELLQNKLLNYGNDPEKLIKERKRLRNELGNADIGINEDIEDYKKYLLNSFIIMGVPFLENVNLLCDDLEEKGFIPAEYKKKFLEYLLERNECICGADLSKDSDAYNKLEEICNQTDEVSNISEKVNQLLGSIKTILNKVPSSFEEELKHYCNKIEDKKHLRDEIDIKIKNIDVELENIDEKEISNIQDELKTFRTLFKQKSNTEGVLSKKLEDIKSELNTIIPKIRDEKSKSSKEEEIKSSIRFCGVIKKEVKRIYKELESDIHDKLEKLTSEEFKRIHWKESYNRVSIDKLYNVSIYKDDGSEMLATDLSSGGKLTLALSFMTALNSLAGFELPILIDTPMGRLDDSIKKNIGKHLHEYTKNKQVTFIVTGTEYSSEFKEGIKDFIGKEYILDHNEENGGFTKVRLNNEFIF